MNLFRAKRPAWAIAGMKRVKPVVLNNFEGTPKAPLTQPAPGAFELESLDDKRTRVEFTILADPGGSLPKWVASMVSRYIPFYTLRNLQRQVEKTRGKEEYRPFILRAKSVVGGWLRSRGGLEQSQEKGLNQTG